MQKVSIKRILPIIISALTMVISLLTSYFVAKPLGSELYGKVQFYLGISQTLSIIGGLGLSNYITKEVQSVDNRKAFFTRWFILVLMWNIIILPVYVIIAFFAFKTFNRDLVTIILVGIMSFGSTILLLVGSFFSGTFSPHKSSFFQSFLPKVAILIASIILIFFLHVRDDFPIYYVYLSIIIYFCLDIIFLILFIRKTEFKFTKKEIVNLISFFAVVCTYGLTDQLSKIIGSEYYGSLSLVGVFSISLQLISISRIFSGAITEISKPYFVLYKDDKTKLLPYYRKITRINAYIDIPFLVGFAVQSKILLLFFGESYATMPYILTILCVGAIAADLTGPSGALLIMADHEKLEIVNGVITIVSFLIFAFLLKGLGVIGLALANSISSILANFSKFLEVWIIYKKCPYDWGMLLHFLIMGVISGGSFFLVSLIPNIYVALAVDVLLGITLIVLFNIVTPNKEDKFFFFVSKEKKDSN